MRPSSCGTARVDSGSRNACSMRWVWYTSCTTCALPANPASTSPRAYTERDSTLPSRPHTASSSLATATAGSVIGASGAYCTSTSAAAHRDEHRPVLVDQADLQHAGDVGAGEDRDDAVDRGRRAGVDRDHVGP